MVFLLKRAAIYSEKLLFGTVEEQSPTNAGKELLGKPLKKLEVQPNSLTPIASESDWKNYFFHRHQIEQTYGLSESAVQQIIAKMRRRQETLDIQWYFLEIDEQKVGAVGLLLFTFKGQRYGRLQDVDIFPTHQSRGYGNQLLAAIEYLATQQGATHLFLSADTDDWPLSWYKRHDYKTLALINKQET